MTSRPIAICILRVQTSSPTESTVRYGHIQELSLCSASVRYREESSRLLTAAETVEIGHNLPLDDQGRQ
jgi:hypothetical protein